MTLFRVGFLLAMIATPCLAQTGSVTFYSEEMTAKDTLKATVMPAGIVPFFGWIYDGPQRLAREDAGRFVTFRLPVGLHTFSATTSRKHPGKATIALNLQTGEHACLRLRMSYVNPAPVVLPVAWVTSKIEEVPCDQATKEAAKTKPLESKRVDAPVRAEVDASPAFPGGS
ncbi:MAG: hypothetical protein WA414_19775 [Acidobacteriaceae bacterium]